MEEWRNVPGFNGKYQIDISTKEGRCRSMNYNRTGKIKVLANTVHNERICWNLTLDGKQKSRTAAYWIAITYPELVQNEYFDGAEIDHIDTDTMNNHPANLRWATHKDNINNPLTKIHRANSLRNNEKTSKQIVQYTLTGEFIKAYPSLNEAERQTGLSKHNIRRVCDNSYGYKSAGGFAWKYKE